MLHRKFLFGSFVVLSLAPLAGAQEVQTDPATGVQYQVTGRQVYQRPVSETHIEQHPYTVYNERLSTEYQPSYRTVYTPVTEYSYEPYMADRWNPFTSPHVEYRYVPHTRWDMHTEETQIPVTHRDLVPEQRVMQVPVTTQHLVAEEHITRVAVNTAGGSTLASTGQSIGGTANLQNSDPPRQAANLGSYK